jgi:hypothetical protein
MSASQERIWLAVFAISFLIARLLPARTTRPRHPILQAQHLQLPRAHEPLPLAQAQRQGPSAQLETALTAFFLVLAALNLGGGYWYLTVARSGSART